MTFLGKRIAIEFYRIVFEIKGKLRMNEIWIRLEELLRSKPSENRRILAWYTDDPGNPVCEAKLIKMIDDICETDQHFRDVLNKVYWDFAEPKTQNYKEPGGGDGPHSSEWKKSSDGEWRGGISDERDDDPGFGSESIPDPSDLDNLEPASGEDHGDRDKEQSVPAGNDGFGRMLKYSDKPPTRRGGGGSKKKAAKREPKRRRISTLAKCYTRASIDEQVELKKPAKVEVIISLDEIKKQKGKGTVSSEAVMINPDKKISVCVRPAVNMKTSGVSQKIVKAPTPGNPVKEEFSMIPTKEGICKVHVDIWQDQTPVCGLVLETKCVKKKTSAKRKFASLETRTTDPFPKPVMQLKVFERENGKSWYYDYEFSDPEKGTTRMYRSKSSNVNREKFITNLFRNIDDLWETSSGDAEQFQHELRSFAASLFIDLFPRDLQQFFYDNVKRINPLQLFSTEPYIPWELLLVRNPDESKPVNNDDMFLGQLGLTRWLHGPAITSRLRIRSKHARYVVPVYVNAKNNLPAAEKEELYLVNTFKATPIAPIPSRNIYDILKGKGFDLLHFCCHGSVYTGNIMDANLFVSESLKNGKIQAEYITQEGVRSCGSICTDEVKPMVVVNTCQSAVMGKRATSFGGFASTFLSAGAGAFVGSMWSIEDEAAVDFVSSLYNELKKGKTLAEAANEARMAAHRPDDATWISYVIYGSPFAVLNQ